MVLLTALASLALVPFSFVHHNDSDPYGWHMSCERFQQRAVEIAADKNVSYAWRMKLIGYLMTKVEDPSSCELDLAVIHQLRIPDQRKAPAHQARASSFS